MTADNLLGVLRRLLTGATQPKRERAAPAQEAQHVEHRVVVQISLPEAVTSEYYASQTRQRHRFFITTVVSVITMAAVIAYTLVSWNQWKTAERSVEITERAWLIGSTAELATTSGSKGVTVAVRFTNSGKSPAFHVRHGIQATRDFAPPKISLPLGAASEVTVPPGGTITTTFLLPDITLDELQKIRAGVAPLFLWLAIRYSDPFSGDPNTKDRRTRECWVYSAPANGFALCPSSQEHT
jgi:hypothetical protein